MSFIFFYSIFAVATGIAALYELLVPIVQQRLLEGFEVRNMYMTYFVFFVIVTIVAPLVFFSCVIPSMGDTFRKSLYKGLFKAD